MSNKREVKLKELQKKISVLRDKKAALDTEARKWSRKRDVLNERVKNLSDEIKKIRNKRDNLNQKVQNFKDIRERSQDEINQKIQEIQKLNQKIEPLLQKRPRKSLSNLKEEIQDKEWKIQTTSMSLEREKELVNQVQQLASKMHVHQKLKKLYRKKRGLQDELDTLKTQNNLIHNRLLETAKKSQEYHQEMLKKIDEIKGLSTESDEMHQKFVQSKQKLDLVRGEIAKVLGGIQKLRRKVREDEKERKRKKEEALRKEIGDKAREKLSKGGKLTFGEFKVLVEGEEGKQD